MKNFFVLVLSFSCSQVQASYHGSEKSKMDRENWVLTHPADEILPFPARRVWQNATQKVISNIRLQKVKVLKADLVKARVLTFKMQRSLQEVAQKSGDKIETLQVMYENNQRDLKFNHHKQKAYKATMHQQFVALQNHNAQLKTEFKAFQERQKDAAELFQVDLQELQQQLDQERSARATSEQALHSQLTAAQTAQATASQGQQTTVAQLNAIKAKYAQLKASFLLHYDHFYKNYSNSAAYASPHIPIAITHTLHRIVQKLPVNAPMQASQLWDANNLSSVLG